MGSSGSMIIMMIVLFAIMYFFMIRPQQKKQKALQEARNAIKVGDKVVTAGGIHGKVKEIGDTSFVVEIADGVRIKIEKASVYVSAEDTQANK
ncbi:preprotein translocase subunit YajC [Dysgonomonas sp. Marseille-P4677]|uniref:preprotein translocase subunit YajC n=1 Tax=Dysgonomonas sp. Marseille-P4677 TaxID=2364790 RepID=UPI0019148995|nr:preprotein translocase subunit YajC [Dysgonomonas sp. Marseille-P4677]MBK5722847.1 preprotein translocase subunit YajC [Dysgonomonas sp. Marseille-P4677]